MIWVFNPWLEVPLDFLEHNQQVLEYLLVFKADHPNVVTVEELSPLPVPLGSSGIEVTFAIQLNGQTRFGAIEVDGVFANAVLAAKLFTLESATLQVLPEKSFCRSKGIPSDSCGPVSES